MAKEIPKWRQRQKLLYDHEHPTDPKKLSALGELCFSKGHHRDALLYFQKAKDEKGMNAVKDLAFKEGDVFLFLTLEPDLGPFSPDIWAKIGETALNEGKLMFAKKAFEKTEKPELLEKVEALLEKEGFAEQESSS